MSSPRISLVLTALVLTASAHATVPVAKVDPASSHGFDHDTIIVGELPHGAYVGTAVTIPVQVWRKGSSGPTAGASLSWTSSKPARAWVAEGPTLVMLEPGKVTLTASWKLTKTVITVVVKANPVAKLAITQGRDAEVRTGDTLRLATAVTDGDGKPVADAKVDFSLALRGQPSTATAVVTDEGVFAATAPGIYTVLAMSGDVADRSVIVVRPRGEQAAPASAGTVRKIEIADGGFEGYVGTTIPLAARVWAGDAGAPRADLPVRWSSSDPRVAVVDGSGVVAFRAPGRVTITAELGGAASTRKFNVQRQPAAHLAMTVSRSDLHVGDTLKLREEVWQKGGTPVHDVRVNYAVVANGRGDVPVQATISDDRLFVASAPGVYTIIAEVNGLANHTTVVVREREPGRAVGER